MGSGERAELVVAADAADAPFADLTPLAPLAVRAARSPVDQGPWARRLWDRLLNALPVLLMGLLAATTWWLVKNTPVPAELRPKAPPEHVADAVMHGFSLNSHGRNGELLTRLDGDAARHFPDTDTYEIDAPRVRRIDAQGRVLLGSARVGLSNGDGSQVRLSGDARVLREAAAGLAGAGRVEFRGELLEFFARTEQVRSSRPVQVHSARTELQAGSLDYDHLQRVAQFGGRVTGVFRPPGVAAPEPTDAEGGAPVGTRKK